MESRTQGHATKGRPLFTNPVQLDNNNRTMPLYSGPLPEATAVLPMGQFHLYAKITGWSNRILPRN